MQTLALAGPSIHWPNLCACCCREADTAVNLDKTTEESSYNFFTGSRTTKYQTRSWSVPYCKQCLAHIHEERKVAEQYPELPVHLTWVVVMISGLGWIVAAAVMGGFGWPIEIFYLGIGLLLAAVVSLTWLTYPACRERYRRKTAEVEQRRAALRARVDADMCESCSSRGHLAVRYDGWREESHYGEWREDWHYFHFESADFAGLMAEINGEKCKRVQQPSEADGV